MKSYEDVVKALEKELGWDIKSAELGSSVPGCYYCGHEGSEPLLYLTQQDGGRIIRLCADRIACAERQKAARRLLVDSVTLREE